MFMQDYVRSKPLAPLFTMIPPERVGVDGEYDHYGLQKRVCLALEHNVMSADLQDIQVKQRGAVVVLLGTVRSQSLRDRIVSIALSVTGAVDVETNGLRIDRIGIEAVRSDHL